MATIPRPRIFFSVLIWVVSCCGLLMIWQSPPNLPSTTTSSDTSPPSSLPSAGRSHDEYFLQRLYLKEQQRHNAPPRTHVSNLLYLQQWEEEEEEEEEEVKNLGLPVYSFPTELAPLAKSYLYRRSNPYSKISFRDGSMKKSNVVEERRASSIAPMRRKEPSLTSKVPTTYHRTRVKDRVPPTGDTPTVGREVKRHMLDQRKKSDVKIQKKKSNDTKPVTKPNFTTIRSRNMQSNPVKKVTDNNEPILEDDNNEANDEYEDDEYDEESDDDDEKENYEYDDAYEDDNDLGGSYNVTPSHTNLLIYNRVPKCASSTMQTILRRLSRHLNFEHVSSLIYDQHQLTQDDQIKLIENLTASVVAAPSHVLSYDRHLYYTNFSGQSLGPPVYVNIVRNPVERFISSFYYRRSEERLNRLQMHGRSVAPSLSWVNRTVEQCVVMNDTECTFLPGEKKETMLSYFCGHHDFCRIVGHRKALQTAKQVVAKEYSVVGLVEHMELSLLLLETLVPRFMEGALQIYENIRQKEHMAVNVNQQKPKVSTAVRDELLRRMADDVDFYHFIEQRLFEQKKNFLYKK